MNSVIIFSISNYLTQMFNFLTGISDCDYLSATLLDVFLPSDANICSTMAFPPLGDSDHILVSVSIDILINSKHDASFHRITYDYSCDHLRDVLWEDIFKFSASAAGNEFCEWVQVGIDGYISLALSTRSRPTHLYCFQLLLVLS